MISRKYVMEWWVFLGSDGNVGITVLRIFRRASECRMPAMMRFWVVFEECGISMVLGNVDVFMMGRYENDVENIRFSKNMIVFQGRKKHPKPIEKITRIGEIIYAQKRKYLKQYGKRYIVQSQNGQKNTSVDFGYDL